MFREKLIPTTLFAVRHPLLVAMVALVLGLGSALLAATKLEVTTDVDGLFSASLPWKQREAEMKALFPQFNDLLVAVVRADSPEAADATANGLLAALQADKAHFHDARRPDASPYLDREGLLFLDTPVLQKVLDDTIDAQPFLGQLAGDPSARGLFAALALVGIGVERGEANLTPFLPALSGFADSLESSLAGTPRPLSWESLLAGPLANMAGKYRIVLARPLLDYSALMPGGAATAALRAHAAELEFVRSGAANVRVTGSVALSDEEFATVAHGAVSGLIVSTILVIVWLFCAVRTWRLIVPILLTLILGLLLTTGFATIAVNPLTLISLAFAVLFVGIAVDFAIQFSVRWREEAQSAASPAEAMARTVQRSGAQITVAAAATATGFLAFTPTKFSGVAELGAIAGVGMLIAFACTMLVLPALIVLFNPDPGRGEVGFAFAPPIDRWVARRRWVILTLFGLLAVGGVAAIPLLHFDSDPLSTKNPNTEAMRTLADLAADPLTNPYTIDLLARDAAEARAIVAKVEHLPLVAQVVSLDSFVPTDQQPKLELIADAAELLRPTLAARPPPAPVTAADIRLAARAARAQLARALPRLPQDHPLHRIDAALARIDTAPDASVMAANLALTRFLPDTLSRLRTALEARPVTEADVPPEIRQDWELPDGRRRVQVGGNEKAARGRGLRRFVAEIEAVVPEAGGSAVTIVETAHTIVSAFIHAATGALVGVMVILAIALRRLRDMLLVVAPLVLSALLTLLLVVVLPLPINFANVIALPLLLGLGVSFNIYFVMNWRVGLRAPLASPTARAVVFSALTTATAFGSLALSPHPGTASMGQLLLLSLGCTLIVTLLFVPALLATLRPQTAR